MLFYIIDGYNLVHKISEIKKTSDPCNQLIAFIYRNKFTGSRNNQVWLVFDGNQPPYQINPFSCKVFFSSNQSADDFIIAKIKKVENKKQVVVVSDDRELGYQVKRLGAKVYRVDEFISKKEKKQENYNQKEIKYSDQREITEQLRKIWLKDEE